MSVETKTETRPYLLPYRSAARIHGGGFSSLLWASPMTQRARFGAIAQLCDPTDQIVLDVGCGRADLLDYFTSAGVSPRRYIGIEAVEPLAQAAGQKRGEIVLGDFVRHPEAMDVGADLIVFSGSLNTLEDDDFFSALRAAFNAAQKAVIFNFLSSPILAGKDYLRWRRAEHIVRFAESLSNHVRGLNDYLPGDATIAIGKDNDASENGGQWA